MSQILIIGLVSPYQQTALKVALAAVDGSTVHHVSKEALYASGEAAPVTYHHINYKTVHDVELLTPEPTAAIDADLLGRLAIHEFAALNMIDRVLWKRPRYRYYDVRRHLYYTMLGQWLHFLRSNRIERILFHNVPHEGYDYIIYILACELGIECRILFQLPVVDSCLCSQRIETLFAPIEDQYRSSPPDETRLSPRMEKEFQLRSSNDKPFYMQRKQLPVGKRLQQLWKKKLRMSARHRRIRHEVINPHDALAQTADLNNRFIYFALHFQPEMTTNPLGGRFSDQYLAIKLLADHLPSDVLLYVKEHPAMYGTDRATGRFHEFYQLIGQLPQTVLVKQDTESVQLIEHCIASATITGTVGWESLFRNKPTITFGQTFYNSFAGCHHVQNAADAAAAIEAITTGSQDIGDAELKRCLHAIDAGTREGVIYDVYQAISIRSSDENRDGFIALLRECLTAAQSEATQA